MAKAKLTVTPKVAGAAAFQSAMKGLATGGISAMFELAISGSKVKAIWEGIKWTALAKAGVAGMGALSLTVLSVVQSLRTLLKTTGALEIALKRVEDIEMRTTQFEPLLKGAQLAKERLADLVKFAATTPFQLPEIADASRMLEVMGRGALSSVDTLKMVGDAAAAAGRGLEEVAFWVGRFYDGLQAGRPVGEAATRLQEMGLISGKTRARVEELTKSGADMSVVWQDIKKELRQTEGSMKKLSQTIGGLRTTLADTKDLMAQKFGDPFAALQKEKIESTIKVLENITPAVEAIGRDLAMIERLAEGEGLKRHFMEAATGAEGFTYVVTALWRGLLGLGAVSTAITGIGLAVWLMRVASSASLAAKANGAYALAVRLMAAESVIANVAGKTLAGSLNLVGKGAGAARKGVLALTLAMLKSPWTWVIAAIGATVGVLWNWVDAQKEAAKAAREMAEATNEIGTELDKQIKSIETADQKMQSFRQTMTELSKVQGEIASEQARVNKKLGEQGWWGKMLDFLSGTDNFATLNGLIERQDMLIEKKKEIERLDSQGLRKTEAQTEREKTVRERERDIGKEQFEQGMERGSTGEQLKLIADRRKMLQEEISVGEKINSQKANESPVIDKLQAEADAAAAAFDGALSSTANEKGETLSAAFNKEVKARGGMSAIRAREAGLGEAPGSQLRNILTFAKTGIGMKGTGDASDRLLEQMIASEEKLAEARRKSQSQVVQDSQLLSEIRSRGTVENGITKFKTDSEEQKSRLKELGFFDTGGGRFDFSQADIGRIQEGMTIANEKAGREEENRSEERALAAQQQRIQLERRRGQISIDQERELLALNQKGIDLIERETKIKIDALNEEKSLLDANADQERQTIDNKITGLQKALALEKERVEEVRKVAELDARMAQMREEAADAFIRGDFAGAAKKSGQAQREEEDETQRRRLKQLVENENMSLEGAQNVVKMEAEARRKARVNEANTFRQDQAQEVIGLRLQTNPATRQQAQQFRDLNRFKEIFKEGIQSGLDTNEAGRIARARTNAEIGAENPVVAAVASSLAAIGGGGNVAAGDPVLNANQRQVALLENIRDLMANRNNPLNQTAILGQ